MRLRTAFSALLIVALVGALPGAMGSAVAKGKKSGPVVVGKDDPADWGSNASAPQPPGDLLGQELVEAAVGMADAKTLNFIIKLNSLPPWGGMPEVSRYNWDFTVNGTAWQLTGAFSEYVRGVCNPLHTDSCPPPQDPGMQPFFVRQGPCTVGSDCFVRDIVQATFDPAEATITIPVPLQLVKAKPGSKIGPGASTFGGTIYAAPAALVSSTGAPADIMIVSGVYTVPKA